MILRLYLCFPNNGRTHRFAPTEWNECYKCMGSLKTPTPCLYSIKFCKTIRIPLQFTCAGLTLSEKKMFKEGNTMPTKSRRTTRRLKKVTPVPLMQSLPGFWASRPPAAAVELDLFTNIPVRQADVQQL